MPRDIKIRASYTQDASFLARLKTAIELDDKRPQEWKDKCYSHLASLIMLFMEPIAGRQANSVESSEIEDSAE